MKFRTGFVTNSSSISYILFNVKNVKLWDYLTRLGIKLDNSGVDEDDYPAFWDLEYDFREDGVFSNGTKITLPSGLMGQLHEEPPFDIYGVKMSESVSEWLITVFMENYLWRESDGDNTWKNNEAVNELSRILTQDIKKDIANFDATIEDAHIEYEQGFEIEVYTCEEIDIHDGVRTFKIPETDYEYGRKLGDDLDFDGVPGKVITQKWENDQWVTI